MDEKRVEGIVLKTIPFKENDRILSIFTKDRGIISLYVRGLSKKKPALVNLTTPLCKAEFVFRKGRSDLHRFIDGTILDLHLPIRRSYAHLACAGKMLLAILETQMPGKKAEHLYTLLLAYLNKLPSSPFPETLWASFQLKLLKYEGLLVIHETCLICKKEKASRIVEGESRCTNCSDPLSFPFSDLDWKTLRVLLEARQFDLFTEIELSAPLKDAIEGLFVAQYN